ncbi:hypothetical protein BU15DRAFT_77274 [Melanogaster broomeanus]|nr:hypothetical protein BU15DRAFT_77274 [Melanogaster broomeanus]
MGQGHIGAAALHYLEGYRVRNLDLGVLMGDSLETAIVQLFVEAKRHQPFIIYTPSLLTWCAAVSETSSLPCDVRSRFGLTRENRLTLLSPTDDQLLLSLFTVVYLEQSTHTPSSPMPRSTLPFTPRTLSLFHSDNISASFDDQETPRIHPCSLLTEEDHESADNSARGKTQEADEDDPQSMSLEGERGRESSDNAGASPRPGAGDEEHQSAQPTKPPDATCQMASEAVTDPTNPKRKGRWTSRAGGQVVWTERRATGERERGQGGEETAEEDDQHLKDVDEDLPRAHPPPPPIYHHPPSTNPPNVAKDVTMTLRTQDDDSSGYRDVHHTLEPPDGQ